MAKKNILTASRKKKALALLNAGQLQEARDLLIKVCELDKLDTEARLTLGVIYGKLAMHALAAGCFSQVIKIQPNLASAHFNLGITLREQDQFKDAVSAFRKTSELDPNYPTAQECLALALISVMDYEGAVGVYLHILAHNPASAEAHSNLGSVYQRLGRLEEAVTSYRKAQQINPAIGYENLGSALVAQGKFEEAITCYREGVAKNPRNCRAYSNLLMTMNYVPHLPAEEIFKEHVGWGKTCGCAPVKGEFCNDPDPDRKLRIGYVSPDFLEHSVAYFIEPLLARHNPQHVEVYCYTNIPPVHYDSVTRRIQSLAHGWRDTSKMSAEQTAARVRNDSIDILVDLSGHTANNSLQVFALRPAPIQLTYLGYPNTTGMEAMGYRLTDSIADPSGVDQFYTEKLIRLPGCFLCYRPPQNSPEVVELPAARRGFVTFGSFNNLSKMNDEVLAAWAEILRRVPDSRLFLKNASLQDPATRERIAGFFGERGIEPSRLEMRAVTATTLEHLALYGVVDLALDTFPYNGTTTTCEAIWMGVPVVTLRGSTHAGRVGASLLTPLAMDEWVSDSLEQYIQCAVEWAGNIKRLAGLRGELRERLLRSPLTDELGFTEKVEAAYRQIWREWCDR